MWLIDIRFTYKFFEYLHHMCQEVLPFLQNLISSNWNEKLNSRNPDPWFLRLKINCEILIFFNVSTDLQSATFVPSHFFDSSIWSSNKPWQSYNISEQNLYKNALYVINKVCTSKLLYIILKKYTDLLAHTLYNRLPL